MTKPSNPRKRLRRCSSADESFEAKHIPEPNSGCWIWFGPTTPTGYGHIHDRGRNVLVHRFSYEKFKGPLIPGLVIDHLCRLRCCVNPDHLEQVEFAVNVQRGEKCARKTCANGHPRTTENVWINPSNGWRQCRVCAREKSLRYYHEGRYVK